MIGIDYTQRVALAYNRTHDAQSSGWIGQDIFRGVLKYYPLTIYHTPH